MTNPEWQVLEDFEKILDVPYRVQQQMSSESMPRLGSAVPCFELFTTAWESLAIRVPRLCPFINVGLEWAKSYYVRMDLTDSYVIAMLTDPSVRLSWIKDYWEDAWIKHAECMIHDLMVEYRKQISPEAVKQSNTTRTSKADTINSLAQLYGLRDMRVRHPQQSQGPQTIEQEYESYVNGDLWDEHVEILKFWEKEVMKEVKQIIWRNVLLENTMPNMTSNNTMAQAALLEATKHIIQTILRT
ncbi:uncharacterized protein HD556DRAFT_1444272 [Suillus plorans]|uniref:Uncharacterized protein n=1 Tax=Suillus plorans TaxID=116603 RepID=A0A9P7ANV5_9AGAM|nr:uncharacterized protein HD556DRAFT_1444272 [Suillus plorans]KAG1792587.1 hypothetical protein HD556DRAFT_1444272 [Suillus plorans]